MICDEIVSVAMFVGGLMCGLSGYVVFRVLSNVYPVKHLMVKQCHTFLCKTI